MHDSLSTSLRSWRTQIGMTLRKFARAVGTLFKDGPTGRRAALAFGPDVWEVVKVVKEFGSTGEQAIAGAAEWGNLSHAQVNVALGYYGDFSEEVDARIAC